MGMPLGILYQIPLNVFQLLPRIQAGHSGIALENRQHQQDSYPLVNIQKAIENGHIEIVDFPIKRVIFHCYVSSPEGILQSWYDRIAQQIKS